MIYEKELAPFGFSSMAASQAVLNMIDVSVDKVIFVYKITYMYIFLKKDYYFNFKIFLGTWTKCSTKFT